MQSLFINSLHALTVAMQSLDAGYFLHFGPLILYSRFGCAFKIAIFSANHQILKWTEFFPMQKKIPTVSWWDSHLLLLLLFFIWKNFFLAIKCNTLPRNHIRQSRNADWEIVYIEMMITRSFYLLKENFICCTGRTDRIGRTILMCAYGLRFRDSRIHTKQKLFWERETSSQKKRVRIYRVNAPSMTIRSDTSIKHWIVALICVSSQAKRWWQNCVRFESHSEITCYQRFRADTRQSTQHS